MSIDSSLADLRRLYRGGHAATVALVSLARLVRTPRHPAFHHYLRNSLEELAAKLDGAFHALPDDSYLLWTTRTPEELLPQLAVILEVEEKEGGGNGEPSWKGSVETFLLPAEYEKLRLTLQRLADGGRRAGVREPFPERRPAALAAPAADRADGPRRPRGALTAATLEVVERLLDGVELGRFLRRQQVCRFGTRFETVYVEIFTSIFELGRRLFPDLALDARAPLFPALLAHIDRLLLIELLLSRPFGDRAVGVNLSLATLETPEFARFDRALSPAQRAELVIELHWLDWLRDLETGGDRIAALRRSGYRLAVDRLVPGPALAALRPERLDADFYKLVWSEEVAERMAEPAFAEILEPLATERLVLTNCDHRRALELGASLSIRRYQGWLVDRLVREAAAPAPALTRSDRTPRPPPPDARRRSARKSPPACCS